MSGRLYANIYAGFILLKKCARFKNQMCNGMSPFVRKICFIQEHRRRENNYRQQKKRSMGCRFSISHLSIRIDSLMTCCFFKNSLDIINEHFWNSPSKQMHSFDYLSYFSHGK